MRILVVNDDGIKAPGIKRLVQMAAGLGVEERIYADFSSKR